MQQQPQETNIMLHTIYNIGNDNDAANIILRVNLFVLVSDRKTIKLHTHTHTIEIEEEEEEELFEKRKGDGQGNEQLEYHNICT